MGATYKQGGELRSVFTSTTGGVLTMEVGALTGELEVTTRVQECRLVVSVRYAGARDRYTVSGSPAEITRLSSASDERSHEALHQEAVAILTTPGTVRAGNEKPTNLHRLSSTTTG